MERERVILHSDLNNFFASVEIALNPTLAGKPLIVCGDPKERKGVVLAKNEEAKRYGIKTAETVYSALRKCPDVQMVGAHHREYKRYSQKVVEIYSRFTDRIEECSIDECALDMTESTFLFGSGRVIAEKIRQKFSEKYISAASETVLSIIGRGHEKIAVDLVRAIDKIAPPRKRLQDV